jgi:hypothetical protein
VWWKQLGSLLQWFFTCKHINEAKSNFDTPSVRRTGKEMEIKDKKKKLVGFISSDLPTLNRRQQRGCAQYFAKIRPS